MLSGYVPVCSVLADVLVSVNKNSTAALVVRSNFLS